MGLLSANPVLLASSISKSTDAQPESRGIVCQGLNHPRARCSYCLIPQFNVFVQDLRDDMGDDMRDDMAREG